MNKKVELCDLFCKSVYPIQLSNRNVLAAICVYCVLRDTQTNLS